MLRHHSIDRICCLVLAAVLLITCAYMGAGAAGWIASERVIGYENRLFDTARVHTLDIVMEDWDGFLASCTDEEYVPCHLVIDGESYRNVAIRAKGNTSLSSVRQYGNNRYSFKIEFDHYQPGSSYHGLDKLSLNNLIQDNTYLKDYFAYSLMRKGGAAAPLCSFVQINVNGQPWGLYLAVEGVEDSFLRRNDGNADGELYKPDSMSFGGGRGNGKGFDMEDFRRRMEEEAGEDRQVIRQTAPGNGAAMPFGMPPSTDGQAGLPQGMPLPDGQSSAAQEQSDSRLGNLLGERNQWGNRGGGRGMGSSDVLLQYIDDDPASYSNIFDNAKTDVSEADQRRLIQSLKALSEGDVSVVDQQAVIRYLAVHNFLCNDDSYTGTMVHNYYLHEKDGVLSMLPWDYNLAFGGFGMGGGFGREGATSAVNRPIDSPVTGGDISTRPILSWIFQSEETLGAYHAAYRQFISEAFDSGWFAGEIDRVTSLIAPYVQADPTAFCTYEEFQQGVETLRAFCLLRAQSVTGQLGGSIPATSEGQRTSDALVDASHLNLSDMGSMGNIRGGQLEGFGGRDLSQGAQGFGGFPWGTGRGRNEAVEDTGRMPEQAVPAPPADATQPGMQPSDGEAAMKPIAGETAKGDAAVPAPPADTLQPGMQPSVSHPFGEAVSPASPSDETDTDIAMPSRPFAGRPMANFASSQPSSPENGVLLSLCAVVLLGAILLVNKYRSNL